MFKNVTDTVFYVGVDDKDIDLFENQYIVPNGIAYNSYVIMDEKIAIMDMVDAKCADQWFANGRSRNNRDTAHNRKAGHGAHIFRGGHRHHGA